MPLPIDRPIPERVALRAFSRWKLSPGGCYISTYSVASHGYAQIGWKDEATGRMTGTTAHRAAWAHANGQPGELTVDHDGKCDHRCVNVDHLRLLPNFENARRTDGRDWPIGECVNGHPNSLLVKWGGKWKCRECALEWNRRYRRKQLTA